MEGPRVTAVSIRSGYEPDPSRVHDEWIIVTRKADQYLVRLPGQKTLVEVFPESETKLFALSHTPQQISFNLNAQGQAESYLARMASR